MGNQNYNNHPEDNQGSNNNKKPKVNPITFNLLGYECSTGVWDYIPVESFTSKVKEVAEQSLGKVYKCFAKWYKDDSRTTYDKNTGRNKPIEKIVIEVWVDEFTVCQPAPDELKDNPLITKKTGDFNQKAKEFIAKYSDDPKLYEVSRNKRSDYANGKKYFCIAVSIQKFAEVCFDMFGNGYKDVYGVAPEGAPFRIEVWPIWNSKSDHSRGIKGFKVSKSNARNEIGLVNRNPFYTSKKKKRDDD